MNKYKPLMNRKGASSVLIILMMVVLVVFGLAALTTSMAAMRLGEKSNDWTGEYYDLEADAQQLLFDVDTLLHEAEKTAVRYIQDGAYLSDNDTVLPVEIQSVVYNSYNFIVPETASGDYLKRVFEAVFYNEAIDSLADAYPQAQIRFSGGYMRQILEDEGYTEIIFSITVSEKNEDVPKNLDVAIRLTAPGYSILASGNNVSGIRKGTPAVRYKVLTWKEWQQNFDYSEKIGYEDPF